MPDLFPETVSSHHNLLPYDGEVRDYGCVLTPTAADAALHALLAQINWQHDVVVLYGRRIVTRRKVAWHGDAPFAYTYSGATRHARPWIAPLLALKALVQQHTGTSYNACLLNLYHDGQDSMAWHSDDESELLYHGSIASLSLGAARRFCFKHKRLPQEKREILLQHGQLIDMRGTTQQHWLHGIPKAATSAAVRVSLTFRCMAPCTDHTLPYGGDALRQM